MKTLKISTIVLILCYAFTINAQEGLVAYWSFDELATDTIFDQSQSGYFATNYGATLVPGKIGNALFFDGIDDYVRIPENGQAPPAVFSTLGKGSIAVWFKANNIPTVYGIAPILFYGAEEQCDYFDAANKGLIIELGHSPVYLGSEAIFFTIWKNGCTLPSFCFDSYQQAVSTDQWHHYVAVVGEGFNTGYLDGVEMFDRRYSFGNPSYSQFFEDAVVHEKMWLGKGYWDNTTQYFEGTIDELRIYDNALTSEEVSQLYLQTSINDHGKKISKIKIFPNPAKENLNFDLSEIEDKILAVNLTDVEGKTVLSKEITSNEDKLYVGNLRKGLYLINFIGESKTYTEQVMITK